MNRNLLIAGGITLLAGGLAYAYLAQGKPAPPPNGPPPNGPPPSECILLPGDDPGYGYPNGWRKCDPYNSLCQWDDHTKQWILLQGDSTTCLSSHKKCYVSSNTGYAVCDQYPGSGTDECSSYAQGCSCAVGQCQPNTWCCRDVPGGDVRCRLTAIGNFFYATQNNMNCFWQNSGPHYCNYHFNDNGIPLFKKPMAINKLMGTRIHYAGGPGGIGEWVDVGIWGFYKGQSYTIWEGTPWVWPGNTGIMDIGNIVLPSPRCIDTIQIGMDALFAEIYTDAFECSFLFG